MESLGCGQNCGFAIKDKPDPNIDVPPDEDSVAAVPAAVEDDDSEPTLMIVVIAIGICAAIGIAIAVWIFSKTRRGPSPKNVRASANFPVLIPPAAGSNVSPLNLGRAEEEAVPGEDDKRTSFKEAPAAFAESDDADAAACTQRALDTEDAGTSNGPAAGKNVEAGAAKSTKGEQAGKTAEDLLKEKDQMLKAKDSEIAELKRLLAEKDQARDHQEKGELSGLDKLIAIEKTNLKAATKSKQAAKEQAGKTKEAGKAGLSSAAPAASVDGVGLASMKVTPSKGGGIANMEAAISKAKKTPEPNALAAGPAPSQKATASGMQLAKAAPSSAGSVATNIQVDGQSRERKRDKVADALGIGTKSSVLDRE